MQTLTTSPRRRSAARSDALWNLLGSLIYAGCQWLVLVATVKLSSVAEVGRLSLAFALTAPIFLLLQLRLRAASATDAKLAYSYRQYALLRFTCTALALAATLVLCFAIHLKHDERTIVIWVALAKAVESGSDLTYGLLQRQHNLRVVALSMAARGVSSVLVFGFLLRSTGRLSVALAGLVAAWALVFLAVDIPCALRVSSRQEEPMEGTAGGVLNLAWLTLPLGLSMMFTSLSANMPRYFIQHALGAAALGAFSAAAYLTMTGSVVISAIAESTMARMAQSFAAGETLHAFDILRRVRNLTLLLNAVLIAGSVLGGRTILAHLYRAEYAGSGRLLILMMCAAGAANLASVYGYALIAARRFQSHLACLVISSLVTAMACAFAVPRWSTMGAAVACLVGYGFQFLTSRALLQHGLRLQGAKFSATVSFPPGAPSAEVLN